MRTWVLCLVKSIWYCGLTLIVRDELKICHNNGALKWVHYVRFKF